MPWPSRPRWLWGMGSGSAGALVRRWFPEPQRPRTWALEQSAAYSQWSSWNCWSVCWVLLFTAPSCHNCKLLFLYLPTCKVLGIRWRNISLHLSDTFAHKLIIPPYVTCTLNTRVLGSASGKRNVPQKKAHAFVPSCELHDKGKGLKGCRRFVGVSGV
jgi:hypothetical protein